MSTISKFDIKTASRSECLDRAERMLATAIRSEEEGKIKMSEMAFTQALKAEDAAFDGRS